MNANRTLSPTATPNLAPARETTPKPAASVAMTVGPATSIAAIAASAVVQAAVMALIALVPLVAVTPAGTAAQVRTMASADRGRIAALDGGASVDLMAEVDAGDAVAICAARSDSGDPFVGQVVAALALLDENDVRRTLASLEPEARSAVASHPTDLAAHYRLAVVVGARTDVAGGRTRIRLANELYDLATEILAVDQDHAGAHHILGRLHAAVMRIGRVQRFLARKILGGAALEQASWGEAQRHLEAAEAGDACVPDHHYELARLLEEAGRPEAAKLELDHVMRLTEGAQERRGRVRDKAIALRAEIR